MGRPQRQTRTGLPAPSRRRSVLQLRIDGSFPALVDGPGAAPCRRYAGELSRLLSAGPPSSREKSIIPPPTRWKRFENFPRKLLLPLSICCDPLLSSVNFSPFPMEKNFFLLGAIRQTRPPDFISFFSSVSRVKPFFSPLVLLAAGLFLSPVLFGGRTAPPPQPLRNL